MNRYHNDPTANRAVGAVDREWRRMKELAKWVRACQRGTKEEQAWARQAARRFTGIFERLLHDDTEEDA